VQVSLVTDSIPLVFDVRRVSITTHRDDWQSSKPVGYILANAKVFSPVTSAIRQIRTLSWPTASGAATLRSPTPRGARWPSWRSVGLRLSISTLKAACRVRSRPAADASLIGSALRADDARRSTARGRPRRRRLLLRLPARRLLRRQRPRVLDADVHPPGKVAVAGEVFRADAQPAGHLPALHHGGRGPGRGHQPS